jgi:hypothetical protein
MRVLCRRIESATTGAGLERSPWLTVGREYDVLEIVAQPGREVLFRLLGDDATGGPGLWDSRLFTAASTDLPSHWVASVDGNGIIRIGPEAWQREGFWEAYFDGDPAAVRAFESAVESR